MVNSEGRDKNRARSGQRTQLSVRLAELMHRYRFGKRALAQATNLSESYIHRLVGSGLDPRTGKPIRPREDVLELLAKGLAQGDPITEQIIYGQLIEATGYRLPPRPQGSAGSADESVPSLDVIVRDLERTRELSEADKEAVIRFIERARKALE